MAIISCRECGQDVSEQARNCPNCGVSIPSEAQYEDFLASQEALEAENKRQKWEDIGGNIFVGVAILLFFISGAPQMLVSSFKNEVLAACEVEKVTINPDIFINQGAADAGVNVVALVRKEKRAGDVTVTVRLSSSEGDIEKHRTVNMQNGQRANIVLQFPEPTINALNVQARASCSTV